MTIEVMKKQLSDGSTAYDLRMATREGDITLCCTSYESCLFLARELRSNIESESVETVTLYVGGVAI